MLPQPADLALLIVPAQYVSAELDRCGRAGIRAAAILSSGFAEEGETGRRMQHEIAATARRYDMAEWAEHGRFFQIEPASLVRDFSPASRQKRRTTHASAAAWPRPNIGELESGGLGFAFLDRARPRNFKFRYIVTTGNEAVLEPPTSSTTCSMTARPMCSCC